VRPRLPIRELLPMAGPASLQHGRQVAVAQMHLLRHVAAHVRIEPLQVVQRRRSMALPTLNAAMAGGMPCVIVRLDLVTPGARRAAGRSVIDARARHQQHQRK
jgi:hypothetical protein